MKTPRFVAISLCFLILSSQALAQTQQARPATTKKPAPPASATSGAEARQVAISLLISLADEARSYQDMRLRSRVLGRSADSLWAVDQDRSRAMFRRAWDAADTADREAQRRLEEEMNSQQRRTGGFAVRNPPNLRGEILRLAAKRDRALAEEFINKMTSDAAANTNVESTSTPANNETGQANQQQPTPDPNSPPAAVAQRLRLARQLLEEGNVDLAIQFADEALGEVTVRGVTFLSALRQKNPAAADQRFMSLLAHAANDPRSDATTVSVLSSYVFTPFLVVMVTADGRSQSMQESEQVTPPANFPPQVRGAFMRTAAQILLRPIQPTEQDHTLAGRSGLYFTISRLMPLFEQYAPNYSPELRAQMAALAPDTPEGIRNGSNRLLTSGLTPQEQTRDESLESADRAERAATPEERNRLYANAALEAARRGDAHALDYAEKIEDADMRKELRSFIYFELLNNAIQKKAVNDALRYARSTDLTNVQRTWALLEVTRILKQSDTTRAAEVLDEATTEARRIGGTDPDRARALFGVASRTFDINRQRAWEAVSEAVKAANATTDFTGEDASITARFSIPNVGTSITSQSAEGFDVPGIFASLAKEDLYSAIEIAKSFTSDAPRSTAILAIARSVLNINTPRQTQATQEVRQAN